MALPNLLNKVASGSKWVLGGAVDGSKWVLSGVYNGATWAISGVANGTVTGVAMAANTIFSTRRAAAATVDAGKQFLVGLPPGQLTNLPASLNAPDTMTIQDVETLNKTLVLLSNEHNKLAPTLSDQDLAICTSLFEMTQFVMQNHKNNEQLPEELQVVVRKELLSPLQKNEVKTQLSAFNKICNEIVTKNTGFVFQMVDPSTCSAVLGDKRTYVSLLSLLGAIATGTWTLALPGLVYTAGSVTVDKAVNKIEAGRKYVDVKIEDVKKYADAKLEDGKKYVDTKYEDGKNYVAAAPQKLFNKALGKPDPAPGAPQQQPGGAPVPAPAAAGAPEAGSVADYLTRGGAILKEMLTSGVGTLSTQVLSSAAQGFSFALNRVIGTMDDSPPNAKIKEELKKVITALGQGNNDQTQLMALFQKISEDWKHLTTLFGQASSAMGGTGVYVGQTRILGNDPSQGKKIEAEGAIQENIEVLQKATANAPLEPKNPEWQDLATEEKNKLIFNTTSYLTMKYVYEEVCGLKPLKSSLYLELLDKARTKATESGGAIEDKLKEIFFEEIEKDTKIHLLTKLLAKCWYWLCGSVVKHYIERATTIYLSEVFTYINGHADEKDKFQVLKTMLIDNFTRYLTILGGAYKTVGSSSTRTGKIDEMIMEELEKKEANHKMETQDLYKEVARIVIKKTTESGFIAWVANKILGNPQEIVRSIIDQATGSLQHTDGYAYALNTVIGDLLEEICQSLRTQKQNADNTTDLKAPTQFSEGKKNQLTALVKNLFEILQKSKCTTVDELGALIQGKLLKENLNQTFDGLFIQEIIEETVTLLATNIESLITDKQLYKLTYQFTNLVNNTFTLGKDVPPAEVLKAEQKVANRSEEILRFAVDSAVKGKFDFSRKTQQAQANGQIQRLKEEAQNYFVKTQTSLDELSKFSDLSLESATMKIDKLIEEAGAYWPGSLDAFLASKNSGLHADDKAEIGKIYQELAEQSKALTKPIADLKTHSRGLKELNESTHHLNEITTHLSTIGSKIYTDEIPSIQTIAEAEKELKAVEEKAERLAKVWPHDIAAMITEETKNIARTLIELHQRVKIHSLHTEWTQQNSPLTLIAKARKEKIQSLFAPDIPQDQVRKIEQHLLGMDPSIQAQLSAAFKAICKAKTEKDVDAAMSQFLNLIAEANRKATDNTGKGKWYFFENLAKIKQALDTSGQLDPNKKAEKNKAIQDAIATAKKKLPDLQTWAQDHIQKLSFVDFSPTWMTKLQDWLSEIASAHVRGRVRERLDGCLGLLKREETYRYGLLHHLCFIPYIQRMRKKG